MQSAVASIHQSQAISCCKQKSRPAVDKTNGSAGVAEPSGASDQMWNTSYWNYYRSFLYNEEKTYQLLFKVNKKRTADEQYYEENQQLSEQLLSEVLSEQLLNSAVDE
ncbi:tetraspanin-15-like [Dorcoceras hygrometricum]|uniref:Tetraspanin-15-like n=1 Tax=Dorcoceras hygrometricum TaxID=472368 RepID=A0A2Z7BTA7_9LAMI|nr:tetraspanin-15-like [Dorcoceras hygrometricum]